MLDLTSIRGRVTATVRRDGVVVHTETVDNLVTSVGDQIYAQNAAGIASPGDTATGMLLGTGGSQAVAKSGTGSAIETYISGSAEALDAEPDVTAGVITYVVTWEAADVVDTDINEVVLVNTSGPADSAAGSANTISRAVLSAFDLTASDTLEITWTHTLLGA